jgi:hypothetical protein
MANIPGTLQQGFLSQGPLLFFVKNRRHRLVGVLIPITTFTIVLAISSWELAKATREAPWWVIVWLCCVIVVFAYAELHLILVTFHMIRPGPALVLYDEGIHDRRVSKGVIHWKEISRMWHQRMMLHDWWMLYFYARNPAMVRRQMRLIHRLPSLIRQLAGRGTFVVNFHNLDPGADAALSYIISKLCEHGADPGFPAILKNQAESQSID